MAESDDIVNLARDALSDTFALASREKALGLSAGPASKAMPAPRPYFYPPARMQATT
jgi:hypothetical protein